MDCLKVGIGISTKWDSNEAGKEAIKKALNNLKKTPKFVLVFSTIHYENKGGFKNLLNSIYSELNKDIPLIGGTVVGFMNQNGCFVQGVAILAFFQENLDLITSYGLNVKRNPKKAAIQCAKKINKKLSKTKYKNKILINLISGALIPQIPFIGKVNNVKSAVLGDFVSSIGIPIAQFLGTGVGREEEVIDYLSEILSDYYFFGGSSIDKIQFLSNYQFINNRVLKNSVVALGCATDLNIIADGIIGANKRNKEFNITDTKFKDKIITKIENNPAKKYFFENILEISESQFKNLDAFYYKTSDYFPIAFEGFNEYSSGTGAILGNNLLLGYKAKSKKAYVLSVTGKELVDSIDFLIQKQSKNLPFALFFSSGIILNILGNKITTVNHKFNNFFGKIPYLVVFPINENIGFPMKGASTRVYSTNIFSMVGNNE